MGSFNLKGKVVLVTGASQGIGKAVSMAFAKAGSQVACVARDEKALNAVVQSIQKNRGTATSFPTDLSCLDSLPGLVQSIRNALGNVSVLVNNAGYAVGGLVEDCPIEEYQKNFQVNFYAPLKLIQEVLPDMKEKHSGQIINVTSGVGRRALPGFSSYCATKFALNGLTESLRLEVAPFGIDVISIYPGRVESQFHHRVEYYGRHRKNLSLSGMRRAEAVACQILKASQKQKRDSDVWGPGRIGNIVNYWVPGLADYLIAKKYPTKD